MLFLCFLAAVTVGPVNGGSSLERARDRQDRSALEKIAIERSDAAQKKPDDAAAQYQAALAESFLAEVSVELHDKGRAAVAAEAGIRDAERAVTLQANSAEYNRLLGTLCGQAISSNGLAALRYGKCALTSVNRAIELDPKSSTAYVSHGVGVFYLPPTFGGGVDLAIKDFEKAIELDGKSPEAYLWLGVALRKSNRPAEARKALETAISLNPARLWAKQQLEKTPAR